MRETETVREVELPFCVENLQKAWLMTAERERSDRVAIGIRTFHTEETVWQKPLRPNFIFSKNNKEVSAT